MKPVKDFIAKNKIKVGLVSGVIVVSSVFGTCSFDPSTAPEPSPAPVDAPISSDGGSSDAEPSKDGSKE
mgnify:CR=1 FL=1